jgi:hypothetical protein
VFVACIIWLHNLTSSSKFEVEFASDGQSANSFWCWGPKLGPSTRF